MNIQSNFFSTNVLATSGVAAAKAKVDAARQASSKAYEIFDRTVMGSRDFYHAYTLCCEADKDLAKAERELAIAEQTAIAEKILNHSTSLGFCVEVIANRTDAFFGTGTYFAPSTSAALSVMRAGQAEAMGTFAINDFTEAMNTFLETDPIGNTQSYVPNQTSFSGFSPTSLQNTTPSTSFEAPDKTFSFTTGGITYSPSVNSETAGNNFNLNDSPSFPSQNISEGSGYGREAGVASCDYDPSRDASLNVDSFSSYDTTGDFDF